MLNLFKLKEKTSGGIDHRVEKKKAKITKVLNLFKAPVGEINMIQSIIDLDALTARDVMIPRIDVKTISLNAKKAELQNLVTHQINYSRIPVYEDNIDNVKGILHIKDLYPLLYKSSKKFDFQKKLSEPYFVPESKRILEILKELQTQHIHLAIVVDEYGGFSGILTMEDIIEEIIGDVQDEFDSEDAEIKNLDKNIYSIDARTDLETINEYFHLELPEEEADTLGGYLIMKVGYIPKLNQQIEIGNLNFKIINKRRNSIIRIRMEIKEESKVTNENNN